MVFRNSSYLPRSPLITRTCVGWFHLVVAALGDGLPMSQGLLDHFLGLVLGVWNAVRILLG